MKVLNDYLKDKHFLVGENLTIADVVVAGQLTVLFQTVFDAGYRRAIPNLTDWFERIMSLPSVIRRMGHVRMTEKPFKAFDKNAKPEPVKAAAGKKTPAAKKDDEVDEDDLFGDDDDDAEAAKKAAMAAKAGAKKKKKEVIAMSLVMLEVKPVDDQTNLDDLAQRIYKNIT